MDYIIDIRKNTCYNKGIINIWGSIQMVNKTAEELQEEYYQRITEGINTAGEYFNWLSECVQTPSKDEYEHLARAEYVGNWHQYFMEHVKEF